MTIPARAPRIALGRLETAGRAVVVATIVATALQGILSARSLFADGTLYFWTELHDSGIFWYLSRVSTQALTQAPVVFGIGAGITDVGALARLQSLGMIGLPLAIWMAALFILRRDRLFWPMAITFVITYSTTGFMAVGEYNLSYAVTAASAALLLRAGPLGGGARAGILIFAALLPFSYEAVVFLAPLLAVLLLLRVRSGTPDEGVLPRWFVVTAIALYAVGTFVSGWYILVPRDPANLSGAADILGVLGADAQLRLTVAVGLLVIAGWALGGQRLRRMAGALAVAGAAALLIVPGGWAAPGMHYSARTIAGIALFVAIAVLAVARVRKRDEPADRLPMWAGPAILFVASLVPLAALTAGYPAWLAEVDEAVSRPGGVITLDESGLSAELSARYGWAWTYPFLSRVLADADEVTILGAGQEVGVWVPDPIPDRYDRSPPILSIP